MDRLPLDWTWVGGVISRYGLPVWFGMESAGGVVQVLTSPVDLLFFDARLYLAATQTWLAGGNPWGVQLAGNYFAAPPPTLLALAPLAPLPPSVGVWLLAGLALASAFATVRLLKLPWWWVLF